ncbi:MAG: hypothetical protein JWQ48_3332 [Conexibacter sp.]|nr:hypothetical protein [Conexibacter sp.]
MIIGAAIVALVVGGALLAAFDTVATIVVGAMLVGVAGVALVSLAFLVVGESEDRDRERHPHG